MGDDGLREAGCSAAPCFDVEDGVWRYVNPMTVAGRGYVEAVWKRFD
ncbi:MAG: hypothetical protein GY798_28570 [Hyphomicrobiales bacterium]|nr:hypothetical protein [Hyphomicrobiales bacterium]